MNTETLMKVNHLLLNFDFEKVAQAMNALKWTYADKKVSPTPRELEDTAKSLLLKVVESTEESACISCGGFEVLKDGDYLWLKFVCEEADVCNLLEPLQ